MRGIGKLHEGEPTELDESRAVEWGNPGLFASNTQAPQGAGGYIDYASRRCERALLLGWKRTRDSGEMPARVIE